jgi:putative ABC transport system permease protein
MSDKHQGDRRGRPFEPRPQVEVDNELAFHLEERIREYVSRGMDPAAARAAALDRFGDLTSVRDECTQLLADERRAVARRDWMEDLRQDIRYGVRSALRAPLFSLLAIVTLALGIGANAAVFGVVKSVLLNALPYSDADRLVRVYARMEDGTMERSSLSAGALTDLMARQRSFSRMAPFYRSTLDVTYTADGGPRVITATLVGDGFFQTLGVSALRGRVLRGEDTKTGAPNVIMLSYAAWQREFGGDSRAIGKAMRLNGEAYEVVGVLPRGFAGPMGTPDVWFALDLGPALRDPVRARKQHWVSLIGRLAPNVTVAAAQREIEAIGSDLAREHPEAQAGIALHAFPLRDDMVGETRTPLLVLMASAALVLVITCANLAGALLSRSLSRRKEFAVRIALGAGRGRLVRQLLTESLVLAVAGGVAGLLLAIGGLAAVRSLASTALPAYAELSLDPVAVAVTGLLALLTGVAFGVAPALAAGRSNTQGTLRDETRGASESRRTRRLRGLLVAGQIAMCVSLLAGAGLLVRSLWTMATAPLGFDPKGVLTVNVQIPGRTYTGTAARVRFFEQFEQRLRALPGVREVADVSELPAASMNRNGLSIEGHTRPAGEGQPFIASEIVSDDYFRTMRIPLRSGRTFGPADRDSAPPVVVISESMARRYWPNGNAIGARVRNGPAEVVPWTQVIGIVGDVRTDPARPDAEPMTYTSNRQDAWGVRTVILRTDGDPLALVKPVQRELSALDASIPIRKAAAMNDLLADQLASRRLPVVLMMAFGVLALLLASVGVYAMFASMAAAREREFGVRVALGSSPGAIAGLVLRQGGVWMVVGLAAGALGVVAVARALSGLLYGVTPFDPLALGVAGATLVVAAVVALLVPVRRATRVDPVSVLR